MQRKKRRKERSEGKREKSRWTPREVQPRAVQRLSPPTHQVDLITSTSPLHGGVADR